TKVLLTCQHFEPGHNGAFNPGITAFFYEPEVSFIVKKHLCYNIIAARLYLLLEHPDVIIQIRSFKMLFGITRHTNAKISFMGIYDIFKVSSPVHSFHLLY